MPSNSTPFVAVYMIAYNHGAFIEKAIESVMMQQTTYAYKLFIGEDNSPDDTRAICLRFKEKYPDQIELFLNQANLGAAKNARQVFDACFSSGAKYVALLEGDDYWTDPQKLQKQTDFLDQNPEYVLCFHDTKILKSNGAVVDDFLTNVPEHHETLADFARFGNYIHTPSVVFRNVIREFPFEFEQAIIGDFFLYMLLAEHGKLKYLRENMAVYRHGVGIFSKQSMVKIVKASNRLYACVLSYLQDENIRKIILERQIKALDALEETVKNGNKSGLFPDNTFFKALKYAFLNRSQPSKIVNKIRSKR